MNRLTSEAGKGSCFSFEVELCPVSAEISEPEPDQESLCFEGKRILVVEDNELNMDLMMPEMDGLEATRAIRNLDREDCKNIPIYAMSANAFDEDVKRSLECGMNGHLSKPVNMKILEKTLQEILG